MSSSGNDLTLRGCTSTPLANYLKSLGVLRIVSEQADPAARGYWSGDVFHLVSSLSQESLLSFVLNNYCPTPIIAPWNGGSGFYYREEKAPEKDPLTGKKIKTGVRNQETSATKAVNVILSSSCDRLKNYRNTIKLAKQLLMEMGLSAPPRDKDKEKKEELVRLLRNRLPDGLINWLDASVVLTVAGPEYPPLLGTGGNDGNSDFTSNFMQRLNEVMGPSTGDASAASLNWLSGSLLGRPIRGLTVGAVIGQYSPAAAGGQNAGAGFDSDSLVNPWDFVLMIEGALFFAASSSRRLDSAERVVLSSPFTVRPSGVGYESASRSDETPRPEMWLPLWTRSSTAKEIEALMSEGRARVRRRPAEDAVDFARAVATLGVDRGIDSFERYAFQVRNGLAYFALPLGRFDVRRRPEAELLSGIDAWLRAFRGKASSDTAPNSVALAHRQLDVSIIDMCRHGGPLSVQNVLTSLGSCEKAMTRSIKWSRESFLRPIPPLSPSWLSAGDGGGCEYRLAASLASVFSNLVSKGDVGGHYSLRSNLESVRVNRSRDNHTIVSWLQNDSRDVAWSEGDLISSMNSIMSRRIARSVQSGAKGYPDRGRLNAELADIEAFVEGRTDDSLISDLLWGMVLVDWNTMTGFPMRPAAKESNHPPAIYGVLKLCYSGSKPKGGEIPLVPDIHRRASTGDGRTASVLASRRLRASEVPVAINEVDVTPRLAKRAAAALLFPISENDVSGLAARLLRHGEGDDE